MLSLLERRIRTDSSLFVEVEFPGAVFELLVTDGVEAVDVDAGDGGRGKHRIGGVEGEFFDELGGTGDR